MKNSILQRQLRENDITLQKEIKAKDSTISFLNKEIKDQEEMLKTLNDKFNKQESEAKEMKARLQYLEDQQKNGWPDEKREIYDEYFARGFNFYLVGFMATDPEYTSKNLMNKQSLKWLNTGRRMLRSSRAKM